MHLRNYHSLSRSIEKQMSMSINRLLFIAVTFWLSYASLVPSASAEQFILHDDLCSWPVQPGVHRTSTGASFWEWRTGQHVPTNWVAPVNYRDGTGHVRFEVMTNECHASRRLAFTFWSAQILTNKGTGHFQFPHVVNFTNCQVTVASVPLLKLGWDCSKGNCDRNQWPWEGGSYGGYIYAGCEGFGPAWRGFTGAKLDDHMPPVKVRITVILVAAGDTFEKPAGWDEYGKLELKVNPAKATAK